MTDGMRLSVVVPARNAEGSIGTLVEVLGGQDVDEVLVVDNASQDRTADVAGRAGAEVLHEQVPSAARARNRGWDAATGDVVAFLDADVRPRPHWAEVLRRDFEAPICGGRVVGTTPTRFAQAYDRLWNAFMAQAHADDPLMIPGANLAVATDLDLRFDPRLPGALCEDVDLLTRALGQGIEPRLIADLVVEHPHPRSLHEFVRQEWRRGEGRAMLVDLHPDQAHRHAGPDDLPGYIWDKTAHAYRHVMAAVEAAGGFDPAVVGLHYLRMVISDLAYLKRRKDPAPLLPED